MPAPNISTALVVADFVNGTYSGPSGASQAISDFLTGYETPTANGLEILAANSNRPVETGDLLAASIDDEITHYFEWDQVDVIASASLWIAYDATSFTGNVVIGISADASDFIFGEFPTNSTSLGAASTGRHRLALSVSSTLGGIKASLDGAAAVDWSISDVANFTAAYLGHLGDLGGNCLEGYVRAHHAFPLITSDTDLEALSADGPGEGAEAVTGTGAATIEIAASGAGTFPFIATGDAAIDISASGAGAHGVKGAGAVDVEITATGQGARPVIGAGAATIDLSVVGAGAHGVSGEGIAEIGITADGAGLLVPVGVGAATIEIAAAGVGRWRGWRPQTPDGATWTRQTTEGRWAIQEPAQGNWS